MKVGDLVKWSWALYTSSPDRTPLQGIIINSRLVKTDWEKLIIYVTLLTDGTLCEVREDEPTLEKIA